MLKTSTVINLYSFCSVLTICYYRALSDILASHRGAKSRSSLDSVTQAATNDEGTPMTVVPSSVELFYFYAQSLEQCSKLSTGKPLLDLEMVHKKWLKIYAGTLLFNQTLINVLTALKRTFSFPS